MPKPIPKRATLIAFEGIDGSGKTTAANLLAERLTAHGVGTSLHLNRSLGPVRVALDALAREDGYIDRFDMFGPSSAQFMASLLKWRELLDLAPSLDRADHVVVIDRYLYTHLALAEAHETTNGALLRRLFRIFPAPDIGLFLDVDPQVAAERIFKRGRDTNSLDFLTRLRDGYMALAEMRQFHILPGDADPATVVDAAWRVVAPKIPSLSVTASTSRPARWRPSTLVTHPPQVTIPDDNRALVAPIYQSVKFTFDDVDETRRLYRGERDGYWYSRKANPTLQGLELTLAGLQGREACLVTASGVAAVNLPLLAMCKQGDHVICFAEMYQPTRQMIRRVLERYGVRATLLSIDDIEGIERTLATTRTRLVVFESPTNPVLKIASISRITALAREHGALTLLDNTLAGVHNHGQFDVDVFVHSLTKYVSGHGDVLGGAVVADHRIIDTLRAEMAILGATLDPHAAFMMQRGLKTYFLRYERQCQNAMMLANYLASRPEVLALRYPGLESHPQHELACTQQHDFGAVITFDLQGGPEAAKRFAEALSLFTISSSLGSTDSLILPPQFLQPRDFDARQLAWSAITESTVRISVGIEDSQDLVSDIERALAASGVCIS